MADEHEKDIRNRLCRLLYAGQTGRSLLRAIPLDNASSQARTLYDLAGEVNYEVIQDNTRWNPRPEMLRDLIGDMIPAIVLRSDAHEASGENRILVEVKKDLPLGHGVADSQAVRYFLYLLAMTRQQPERPDMARALLGYNAHTPSASGSVQPVFPGGPRGLLLNVCGLRPAG